MAPGSSRRWSFACALGAVLASAGCSGAPAARVADEPPSSLLAEAGFSDLEGPEDGLLGGGRMFYSFRPADSNADASPLLVVFNGGPGYATTSVLLPYGTGPMTLDAADLDSTARPNDDSWTSFANLLYLDARDVGFSYSLGSSGCVDGRDNDAVYLADAGDFVEATLDFLDAHAALTASPVVLVGESYGGARAALMLSLLLDYADPAADSAYLPTRAAALPWLGARVQAHVDAAFPAVGGAPADRATMATQFGHAALLEPTFDILDEDPYFIADMSADPLFADYLANDLVISQFDIRKTVDEEDAIEAHTAASVRSPPGLEALLGVDLRDVRGLAATERVGAARGMDAGAAAPFEHALRAKLGALGPDDAYWLEVALPCPFAGDLGSLGAFFAVLPDVDVFMTRARYDADVR
ncbi:MAG TPA: hypothetical protein VGM56_18810, partial [Byssovorax sp.]